MQQRIRLFLQFEQVFIHTDMETARIFQAEIRVAVQASHPQSIVEQFVFPPHIFFPFSLVHAGIGAVIYFAEIIGGDKNRIATETKLVQSIIEQTFLHPERILRPFALQKPLSLFLQSRVKPAGNQDQHKKHKVKEAIFFIHQKSKSLSSGEGFRVRPVRLFKLHFKPPIIFSGRTHSSNCSLLNKPKPIAASRSDWFSFRAVLAILAAFS